MIEAKEILPTDNRERRQRRGTWPWFALNILLFPGPAHLTLLRVKAFNTQKNLRHLGITLLLFAILLAAAALQLALPGAGRLWMLLPVISSAVVLYTQRSIRHEFKPCDCSAWGGRHGAFLAVTVVMFSLVSVLPTIDLIAFEPEPVDNMSAWFSELPFWQDILLLVLSLVLLFGGYMLNTSRALSLNRVFILYACFLIIANQVILAVLFTSSWLKIQCGFGMQMMILFLGALLALDYWDARTFGQYVRRFFFLTATKGLTFLFFIFCLLGLPQKAASVFAEYYYRKARPPAIALGPRHLVINQRDRFESAHRAAQRIRTLYTRASLADTAPEQIDRLKRFVEETGMTLLPGDADVCRLAADTGGAASGAPVPAGETLPQFRPIETGWDVMLTAMLLQDTITAADLEKYIAGFKAQLPKTSKGKLPTLESPFDAAYVSLATGTRVDFVEARYGDLEDLVHQNIHPVLILRLAGKEYWGALLRFDLLAGLAWLRVETTKGTHKAIQILYDADEAGPLRNEILSRQVVAVSLDYLRSALEHHPAPAVVFSRNGLDDVLPERYSPPHLQAVRQAVAQAADAGKPPFDSAPAAPPDPAYKYADYLAAAARIKALLEPTAYARHLHERPAAATPPSAGEDRKQQIRELLDALPALREADRVDMAYLMVRHNHVYGMPDLFVRLAAPRLALSDLVDCRDAFVIGRQLFLLGHHQAAEPYLKLAFRRHPFDSEYEMWHGIVQAKLGRPPAAFYSPPALEPGLYLYFQTIRDIAADRKDSARRRIEKALEKDSHNTLANHLLSRYFDQPVDPQHFFPAQEGL